MVKMCIFVVKALLITALAIGISINAFADCSAIFGTGKFRFMYGSNDQKILGAISQCGENKCVEAIVDFGNQGRQRLYITYGGSTWWADWYDTTNKPLWLWAPVRAVSLKVREAIETVHPEPLTFIA